MPEHAAMHYASVLTLNQLRVQVHLGITEVERSIAQDVVIDVRLYFPTPPGAAHDDNGEYICYHSISQKIHALCTRKHYRLIEYLVHEIHRLLRMLLASEVKVLICLRKLNISLPYVEGGASYSFTDLPLGASVAPE